MTRKTLALSWFIAATVAVLSFALGTTTRADKEAADPALDRARQTVRMLDDIYKTTVVLITDKYVHDKRDFPAGSAAVALFEAIEEKGWHKARLVDATGKPRRRKNLPEDDFEKAAVAALQSGETGYEEVVNQDGARQLRVMTPVPVVSEKCILCHSHYEDVKPGDPIGGISYTLKVQ